jgi:hypothetical protein
MENKEIYPQSYLEIVRMRGHSLLEIGSKDIGLLRSDALEALRAIQGARLAVLGVAVLKIVNGIPRHNYDGCHCDQEKGELVAEYFRGSWEKAMAYVSGYPDSDDGTILYALTLAGEDWLRDHSKFKPR